MKRNYIIVVAIITLLAALVLPAIAADEVTITGMGVCTKCAMHETDKCGTAIQVTDGGKTTTYYLVNNHVAKDFHDNICKESKKVTATGTVSTKDGKQMLKASKIDLAP